VAATRLHQARGLIDWQVVRRLWLGSLPASTLTLACMAYAPIDEQTAAFLKALIALAVLVTATALLFQRQLHALGRKLRLGTESGLRFKAIQAPLTIAAGALLGALVTLTSIGAGALGVVFLAYLYPIRLAPPRLIATDIVHAIPLALFAGMGHLLMGNVQFGLLGNLLLGSIPGVLLGAFLSARLAPGLLRKALSAILLFTGAKLLGLAG
jgi:uncharacterized membrane protein YfcA